MGGAVITLAGIGLVALGIGFAAAMRALHLVDGR